MSDLKEGDMAPHFKGIDQNGKPLALHDFRGKKVVLYFYPEDDTMICTLEACNLRDHFSDLREAGFEVIGVSPDDEKSHKKFETKYKLPFHLVADPDKKIIHTYGVWGEKNMYGIKRMGLKRTTFLINEEGIIYKIFRKPRSRKHSEEILAASEKRS